MFDYSRLINVIEQSGGFKIVSKKTGITSSVLSKTICEGRAFSLSQIHQIVKTLPISHMDVNDYFFTLKV
jgi:DNA-binding phage protein